MSLPRPEVGLEMSSAESDFRDWHEIGDLTAASPPLRHHRVSPGARNGRRRGRRRRIPANSLKEGRADPRPWPDPWPRKIWKQGTSPDEVGTCFAREVGRLRRRIQPGRPEPTTEAQNPRIPRLSALAPRCSSRHRSGTRRPDAPFRRPGGRLPSRARRDSPRSHRLPTRLRAHCNVPGSRTCPVP